MCLCQELLEVRKVLTAISHMVQSLLKSLHLIHFRDHELKGSPVLPEARLSKADLYSKSVLRRQVSGRAPIDRILDGKSLGEPV